MRGSARIPSGDCVSTRAARGPEPCAARAPSLVWQQEVPGKREALRLEYRLKQQSKAFKERLVHEPALWHGWSLSWLATRTPTLCRPIKGPLQAVAKEGCEIREA